MKSRFCYFIHAGLLVPKSKELKKKHFLYLFFICENYLNNPFFFFLPDIRYGNYIM